MSYRTINTTPGSNQNPNNNNNGSGSGNNSNSNNNNTTGANTGNINAIGAQAAIKPDVPDLLIDYYAKAKKGTIHRANFRDDVTEKLLTILTTTNHPNANLVGDPGVGKTAIVEDLAVRLYEKDAITIAMLGDKTKIYELPLNSLISGSSMFGAMEEKLDKVIAFVSDPRNHAILYIDEIHQLKTNTELKNVAQTLKPALARDNMHVIGATTTQELKAWNETGALTRRFSNIIVNELSDEQTLTVLKNTVAKLQNKKMPVTVDPILFEHAVVVGNQYAKTLSTSRPDSALTVLDQAMAMARLQAFQLKQAGVPLKAVLTMNLINKAGQRLVNNDDDTLDQSTVNTLKDRLHKNIIGQTAAKKTVVDAAKSIVLDLTPQSRPHSFLFAGMTGTGKTEIAKQLASAIFGSPDRFIYINMTEYASDAALSTLIGSPRGYVGSDSAQPLPLDRLKSNPFQIVLLDEFEKASQTVQRVFMQALDEGDIRYSDGSHVDFTHAIVIGTTNAGTEHLAEKHVGFGANPEISNEDLNQALSGSFPPELINRFEYVVPFESITEDQFTQIIAIKYNKLREQIVKRHPEIDMQPEIATAEMPFIQTIASDNYDRMKNARPAERAVRHYIEDKMLAQNGATTFDFEAI